MDHSYPMAFKAIVQKLKQIKIRELASRLVEGKAAPWKKKKKKQRASRKQGASHGHYVVDEGGSVVVQRGEAWLSEVWLFGAFDQRMGDGVVRFLQSHLFEKMLQSHLSEEQLSEKQIASKAMEIMKNAHINGATSRMQAHEKGGSAIALLVNGGRVLAADFGGYKAVLCEGGKAIQLGNRRRQKTNIRVWSLNTIITEKLFGHSAVDEDENKERSPAVDAEKVGSKTEFIILASHGVWEVLGDQEAVDLTRHIEDAQEAAKCLADEAVARLTKSAVICVIIRFK